MAISPEVLDVLRAIASGPAPVIPIAAIVMYGLVKMSRSPIAQALARRIDAHGRVAPEYHGAELEDHIRSLETRVIETQERLDFAERLLAQGRESGTRLSPNGWGDTPEPGVATPV